MVSSDDLDDLHVYVNILDADTGAIIPVLGEVGDGTITVTTTELPANTRWVVVYDPNQTSATDDESDASNLKALTDAPTSGNWTTHTWCAVYNPRSATLREQIAAALSADSNTEISADDLSDDDIRNFIKDLAGLARISGKLYADAGLRAPAMHIYTYLATSDSFRKICRGEGDFLDSFYIFVIASTTSTTAEDVDLHIYLRDDGGGASPATIGTSSGDIRAAVLGSGSIGSFSSGRSTIDGWGSTNSTAYVIVANTTASSKSVAYEITGSSDETCSSSSLINKTSSSSLTISDIHCPTSMSYGQYGYASTFSYSGGTGPFSGTVTFTYSDLPEGAHWWNLSGTHTHTYDYITFSQDSCDSTSGSIAFDNSYDVNGDEICIGTSMTMHASYTVTDANGNQSNALSCDITIEGVWGC